MRTKIGSPPTVTAPLTTAKDRPDDAATFAGTPFIARASDFSAAPAI